MRTGLDHLPPAKRRELARERAAAADRAEPVS